MSPLPKSTQKGRPVASQASLVDYSKKLRIIRAPRALSNFLGTIAANEDLDVKGVSTTSSSTSGIGGCAEYQQLCQRFSKQFPPLVAKKSSTVNGTSGRKTRGPPNESNVLHNASADFKTKAVSCKTNIKVPEWTTTKTLKTATVPTGPANATSSSGGLSLECSIPSNFAVSVPLERSFQNELRKKVSQTQSVPNSLTLDSTNIVYQKGKFFIIDREAEKEMTTSLFSNNCDKTEISIEDVAGYLMRPLSDRVIPRTCYSRPTTYIRYPATKDSGIGSTCVFGKPCVSYSVKLEDYVFLIGLICRCATILRKPLTFTIIRTLLTQSLQPRNIPSPGGIDENNDTASLDSLSDIFASSLHDTIQDLSNCNAPPPLWSASTLGANNFSEHNLTKSLQNSLPVNPTGMPLQGTNGDRLSLPTPGVGNFLNVGNTGTSIDGCDVARDSNTGSFINNNVARKTNDSYNNRNSNSIFFTYGMKRPYLPIPENACFSNSVTKFDVVSGINAQSDSLTNRRVRQSSTLQQNSFGYDLPGISCVKYNPIGNRGLPFSECKESSLPSALSAMSPISISAYQKMMGPFVTDEVFCYLINIFDLLSGTKDIIPVETAIVESRIQLGPLCPTSRILREVYAYWKSQRLTLNKPLLRELWPVPPASDYSPFAVFRARTKEKMVLRRPRRNAVDSGSRLEKLNDEFTITECLFFACRIRDAIKLNLCDVDACFFEQIWKEQHDSNYVHPLWLSVKKSLLLPQARPAVTTSSNKLFDVAGHVTNNSKQPSSCPETPVKFSFHIPPKFPGFGDDDIDKCATGNPELQRLSKRRRLASSATALPVIPCSSYDTSGTRLQLSDSSELSNSQTLIEEPLVFFPRRYPRRGNQMASTFFSESRRRRRHADLSLYSSSIDEISPSPISNHSVPATSNTSFNDSINESTTPVSSSNILDKGFPSGTCTTTHNNSQPKGLCSSRSGIAVSVPGEDKLPEPPPLADSTVKISTQFSPDVYVSPVQLPPLFLRLPVDCATEELNESLKNALVNPLDPPVAFFDLRGSHIPEINSKYNFNSNILSTPPNLSEVLCSPFSNLSDNFITFENSNSNLPVFNIGTPKNSEFLLETDGTQTHRFQTSYEESLPVYRQSLPLLPISIRHPSNLRFVIPFPSSKKFYSETEEQHPSMVRKGGYHGRCFPRRRKSNFDSFKLQHTLTRDNWSSMRVCIRQGRGRNRAWIDRHRFIIPTGNLLTTPSLIIKNPNIPQLNQHYPYPVIPESIFSSSLQTCSRRIQKIILNDVSVSSIATDDIRNKSSFPSIPSSAWLTIARSALENLGRIELICDDDKSVLICNKLKLNNKKEDSIVCFEEESHCGSAFKKNVLKPFLINSEAKVEDTNKSLVENKLIQNFKNVKDDFLKTPLVVLYNNQLIPAPQSLKQLVSSSGYFGSGFYPTGVGGIESALSGSSSSDTEPGFTSALGFDVSSDTGGFHLFCLPRHRTTQLKRWIDQTAFPVTSVATPTPAPNTSPPTTHNNTRSINC